jgi:hypothetical protein
MRDAGAAARSQIVASIQPPWTPTGALTGYRLQDPTGWR